MANSYIQYSGDGSTTNFAIPFDYIDRAHVGLKVNLVTIAFTWVSDGLVTVSPAPANGAVVEFRRVTPNDAPMVDFNDGSVLTESDLDLANRQLLFIAQESIDIAGGTLELLGDGSYSAGNRRIANVAAPVSAQDAVTKAYHDGTFIPQMNTLLTSTTTAKTAAETAQAAAETARTQAQTARTGAETARTGAEAAQAAAETAYSNANTAKVAAQAAQTAAETAKTGAETAQTGAQSAKTAAESARDTANTHKTDAQTAKTAAEAARDLALGYKNDAAASATAAATFDPANFFTKTALQNGSTDLYLASQKLVHGTGALTTPSANQIMVRGKKSVDFDALAFMTAAGELVYLRPMETLISAGLTPAGSSVAAIDITLPTEFNAFLLEFEHFLPVVDAGFLHARYNNGSGFIATAVYLNGQGFMGSDASGSVASGASDTQISLVRNQATGVGFGGGCGELKFWQPANNSAGQVHSIWRSAHTIDTGVRRQTWGSGTCTVGAGNRATQLRLLASNGNIKQLSYRLYGVQRVPTA
jgi:hypothetical protein